MPSSLRSFLLALGLFAMVWGAKLAVVNRWGGDLPNWDQWDAEANIVLLPYLQHRLTWAALFRSHNEHRPVFTKALNLGLFIADGRQWDNRVECAANAAIHAAFAVAAFFAGRRLLRRRWHPLLFAACACVFGLPAAWQNILCGFQSQFYFLLWCSFGALWFWWFSPPGSLRWWAGSALGLLANFSVASGCFAGAAAVALSGLRLVRGREPLWRVWPTAVAGAVAVGLGFLLRVSVPADDVLHAHTLHEFLFACLACLRWPFHNGPKVVLLVYAPTLWIFWRRVFRAEPGAAAPSEDFLACAALWGLLQVAATGYSRGAGVPAPATRYLDTLAFGLLIQGVILAFALDRPIVVRWRRWSLRVLAAVWLGMAANAFCRHVAVPPTDQQLDRVAGPWLWQAEADVRSYLATGDAARLAGGEPIPYPKADVLIERLSHPEIRAALPAGVLPPGPSGPAPMHRLSRLGLALARRGRAVAAAGAVLSLGAWAVEAWAALRRRYRRGGTDPIQASTSAA